MELTTANKGYHPCFSEGQDAGPGVLRLPVALGCNMNCRYCTGTSIRVLTPEEAIDLVASLIDGGTSPAGVEIAGPGEPLVNAATFTVLTKLHWLYPDLPLSVWTNGLLLPERLDELVRSGVRSLTVSIQAASHDTIRHIHDWIIYRGRRLEGRDVAAVLLHQQWSGIEKAIEAGLAVTVYSVVLSGLNELEVSLIEKRARSLGVDSMRSVSLMG